MEAYYKINNKIKQSLLFFEDSNLLDYFDNNCILFGSCMLKLLNDINEYPYKFNILCNWHKTKLLNKYLLSNNFKRQVVEPKKKYKFIYTETKNEKNTFTFKIFVDEVPIKNIANYTLLKIEEIYYDSNVKYNHEDELFSKTEKINMSMLPITPKNLKIMKKIFKYIKYDYGFMIYENNKLIGTFNESHKKMNSKLKKMIYKSKN